MDLKESAYSSIFIFVLHPPYIYDLLKVFLLVINCSNVETNIIPTINLKEPFFMKYTLFENTILFFDCIGIYKNENL